MYLFHLATGTVADIRAVSNTADTYVADGSITHGGVAESLTSPLSQGEAAASRDRNHEIVNPQSGQACGSSRSRPDAAVFAAVQRRDVL